MISYKYILFAAAVVAVVAVILLVLLLRRRKHHAHRCRARLVSIRKDELLLVRPSHGRLIVPTYIATVKTMRSGNVMEFRVSHTWLEKLKPGSIGTFVYVHGSLTEFIPEFPQIIDSPKNK